MRWDLDFFFSLKNVNYNSKWEIWTLNVLVESWYSTRISWKHQEILVSWGQFLPRPSVALVVIFGLVTKLVVLYHHWLSLIWHEEEGFPSNVGLWTKLVVLYHHWSFLIWHEEEGFPSNMGISKPKMTTSANTWSRQKLSPHK